MANCLTTVERKLDRHLELKAFEKLSLGGVENALQEARWMIELLPPAESPEARLHLLDSWIERRIAGEPFQYIVGSVEFYDIELAVGPGVLIPRPETELLVERSLKLLEDVPAGGRVLDLCTGSGAILFAIGHARTDLICSGVDLSPQALAWAQKNLKALGAANCELLEGDLFTPLASGTKYDLITSNPPYVAPGEYSELPSVVKDYEPEMALEAADGGLELEKKIIRQAPAWLKEGGWLILEMGETQGAALAAELNAHGYSDVAIRKDWCGRDRFAEGRI